ERAPIQSNVISQWVRVAARYVFGSSRYGPLRSGRTGHEVAERVILRLPLHRFTTSSGIVLWLFHTARRGAHGVSGCLHAPGVGRGICVPPAAILSPGDHRQSAENPFF